MFFRVLLTRWSDFTDRFPEKTSILKRISFRLLGGPSVLVQRLGLAEVNDQLGRHTPGSQREFHDQASRPFLWPFCPACTHLLQEWILMWRLCLPLPCADHTMRFFGKRCFQMGRKRTMKSLNGVVNKTSTKSIEPWIHVRAMLISKLWIGLRALTVDWNQDFWIGRQQGSFFCPGIGSGN